jgi:hypothetical protein
MNVAYFELEYCKILYCKILHRKLGIACQSPLLTVVENLLLRNVSRPSTKLSSSHWPGLPLLLQEIVFEKKLNFETNWRMSTYATKHKITINWLKVKVMIQTKIVAKTSLSFFKAFCNRLTVRWRSHIRKRMRTRLMNANECAHVWWTHSISTFFNESYQREKESKKSILFCLWIFVFLN